ncbi:hypothetical protein [Nocardioides sp. YIM 152315]|uniref:hypothetical protein n=1 Tax=Nocardioides sp. YIM 152315 TaxID=3031760 RepID=UPI0023DB039F|nr:hypothetical protein [Nocardioides sp. YIM 152315]MDF1602274.1 hypothetical protein [Nocardioides sp. YIM 152315]
MGRRLVTVLGVALAASLAVPPSPVLARPASDERRDPRVVGVGGPETMILRSGCHETYHAAAVFDAVAGEEYWATINAEDATGGDIDGAIREGVVTSPGRITVTAPLLLCGAVHEAGVGRIKVGLLVGDTDETLRKRVTLKYDDRVSLRKAKRVRGHTTLRGVWSRGKGFGPGLTTYVRKSVRVQLFFKPRGSRRWQHVGRTGIDFEGRWAARAPIGDPGRWQARIAGSNRLLPARSQVRRAR